MRLLLVTDSHGRDLADIVHRSYKGWTVYSVIVGQSTDAIRTAYERQVRAAIQFRPDYIVLHCGHNDVVYHPRYNENQQHIKHFFPEILEFLGLLAANHPLSRVFYSSMLPRGEGPLMNSSEKLKYNKLACRFGVRAATSCHEAGFEILKNFCMWESVRQSVEDDSLLDDGGLHFNLAGKKKLVHSWLSIISNDF
jgi:lysophospholipase L1-like esterase